MLRVSTTPITRSTQNCNYSLRYCAATSLKRGQANQSNEMQHNAVYLLLHKFTLHVSSVNHTHHQERVHKTVTTASVTVQLPPSNVAKLTSPTRCNTKQSIYYSASSLYKFRVSKTPIIRGTQNCNYSLRYWSYFFVPSLATFQGGSCTKYDQ
jgi:hypothetical protein